MDTPMWFPRLRSPKQDLRDEVTFLRAQVAQLQNYILMVAPTAPIVGQTATHHAFGSPEGDIEPPVGLNNEVGRIYSTEDEKDIHSPQEEGLIGAAEAERLLRNVWG